MRSKLLSLCAMLALFALPACADQAPKAIPAPLVDEAHSAATSETAVLAGGCFWGQQGVFEHVNGVIKVVAGYSGGSKETATYPLVTTETTGHAESVQITFDPKQISYGRILQIYFSVAHDPTQLNRQGPDEGTQYRSEIFYSNDEQKHIAESYISQLQNAKSFRDPIVTQVVPLQAFYVAEGYHQNYATLHPNNPYIVFNDAPKVAHLRKQFPNLYKK